MVLTLANFINNKYPIDTSNPQSSPWRRDAGAKQLPGGKHHHWNKHIAHLS